MQMGKYENMLRKFAWGASKKYATPYEENLAEAQLVFLECQLKYIPGIGNFSTFLFQNLYRVNTVAYKNMRHRLNQPEIDVPVKDRETDKILFNISKEYLSPRAKKVVDYLTSWEWQLSGVKGWNRPTKNSLFKKFALDNKVWNELLDWWRENGQD